MCGIVVVIGKNSKVKAKKALNKIKHRGGDDYTIVTIDNMSMGFTRLSINEQSSKGNQPFYYENYIGLFNAEIYNSNQLNKKYNLNIKSKSDCEVILPLYQKIEKEVINILDGFFVGVIYDKKEETLLIIKDYIGKKPLFFAYDEDTQYIISELKALPKIQYFEDFPKGISILKGKEIRLLKKHHHTFLNHKSFLKESLYKAVEKRIEGIKNMKVGIFLSGGLDSSIVASLVNQFLPANRIHYYAIADPKSEDLQYINIMKDFLNIHDDKISYVPLPNRETLLHLLQEVVYATESTNPSIISNGIGAYILSQKAHSDEIKVVITGDGADEVFLGYYNRDFLSSSSKWRKLQQDFINELCLTELRRVDLACMANSVEVRCPFLDKKVCEIALNLEYEDFFGKDIDSLNKNILRDIFKDVLPQEITNRKKVSFDVGSGLQQRIVKLCTENSLSEREYLKNIWNEMFGKNLSKVDKDPYFWSYPQFDKMIEKRGEKYQ